MRLNDFNISTTAFVAIIFFLFLLLPPHDLQHVSVSERKDFLRKASIWHKMNIPSANLLLGPQSEISVTPEAEVSCVYVEEPPSRVGFSPKFRCRLLDSGEVVRIKFSNRETVAEVAGSRLLWALGFYTDDVYSVQLRCFGCPEKNPAHPGKNEARVERLITDAMMERTYNGSEIVQYSDQGWSWKELEAIRAESSPEKKTEIDALKLVAALMQHTDSKRSQQRLGCDSSNLIWSNGFPDCTESRLMIQDLGETFGEGSSTIDTLSAMYFKGWSQTPVWSQDRENEERKKNASMRMCFANLKSAGNDGLFDPAISDDGRMFLGNLLEKLSDQQIHDLFKASRADTTGEKIVKNGVLVSVTLNDWVSAFKKKRQEIVERRCD